MLWFLRLMPQTSQVLQSLQQLFLLRSIMTSSQEICLIKLVKILEQTLILNLLIIAVLQLVLECSGMKQQLIWLLFMTRILMCLKAQTLLFIITARPLVMMTMIVRMWIHRQQTSQVLSKQVKGIILL